jgi:hypothetical protein
MHLRIPIEWRPTGSLRLKSTEPNPARLIPHKPQRQSCLSFWITRSRLSRHEPELPGSSTCLIGSHWRYRSHTLLSNQSWMAPVRTGGLSAALSTSFPHCHS